MRPPWSEATAMLAAHGFVAGQPPPPQSAWSRLMSHKIEYAFMSRLDAVARPVIFTSLNSLAAYIDRKRYGQGIQLEEIGDLHARRRMATGEGPDAPTGLRDRGVQIYTTLLDGGRDRSMGFAWLKGGGLEELQIALTRVGIAKGHDPHLSKAA